MIDNRVLPTVPKAVQNVHCFPRLGELISDLKLYPFQFRGVITISDKNSISELDKVKTSGIYIIMPGSDTYGTLVVYQSFDGAGGVVQRYYHPAGIKLTRIKNSNSDDVWKEI